MTHLPMRMVFYGFKSNIFNFEIPYNRLSTNFVLSNLDYFFVHKIFFFVDLTPPPPHSQLTITNHTTLLKK